MSDPDLRIRATFDGSCVVGEHILQIILEGVRNARRHSVADTVTVNIHGQHEKVTITIADDGIGFDQSGPLPWAIASRVAELGGQLRVNGNGPAHLEIVMPNS
jgi:signal transduction histidine kinase